MDFNLKTKVGFSWPGARLCEPQQIGDAKARKVLFDRDFVGDDVRRL